MKKKMLFKRSLLIGWSVMMLLSAPVPVRAEEAGTETELPIEQIEDSTDLDAEFAALEEESILIVEEVERQRAQARRSKIWGVVIIALVCGIFGVGIVSSLSDKKEDEKASSERPKKGEKNSIEPKKHEKESKDKMDEIEEIVE